MANNIPSVDDIIQQRDKQITQQLQQRYNQVAGGIKQRSEDEKRSIRSRHAFAVANLKRQYDAEKDPGRKQTILNQKITLEYQSMSKLADIDNKYLPENRELETAMKIEMQKIQQANAKRDFEIQLIRKHTAEGRFRSNALARQAEYKALGIDVPLSELQPQERQQSPSAQLSQLKTKIDNIDEILTRYTPSKERTIRDVIWWGKSAAKIKDPLTGEERKLNPDNEEDQAIAANMDKLMEEGRTLRAQHQAILLASPEFRTYAEQVEVWENAKKTINGGGTQGGGLKEMGTLAKGKPKQPTIDMSSLSDEELRAIVGGK